MKTVAALFTASVLTGLASSSAVGRVEVEAISRDVKRATPQAPNGYAPEAVDCPSMRPTIRSAAKLSDNETAWLKKRRANTVEPMRELLGRLSIPGFDASGYITAHKDNTTALPNVAIAFSGGGYRAMTNGAGHLAAFDSRTPNATAKGQVGGLLQASTYIAGLSGGGWLVGSVYANNFSTVHDILHQHADGDLWQLSQSIFEGPKEGGLQILNTAEYYKDLVESVKTKDDAGFNTSLTDIWGRALSFQLINATNGGPGYTFSSIQDDNDFKNGNAPMPILVADQRAPGEHVVSLNATDIEFNPWEMGSHDPTLFAFAPLRYIGSNFTGGRIPESDKCVRGFDNAGFVMGTSSSLFNTLLTQVDTYLANAPDFLKDFLNGFLTKIGSDNNDIADYTPNPFYHYNNGTNINAQSKRMTLVDGGLDGQNIPLNPLIQPIRAVDVIFAIDSSGDVLEANDPGQNWPNGTSLVATYERSTLNETMQNGTAFPAIPDVNTFVNLGLNNRPTFFGCDASNMTGPSPLIVYLPNAPYVYWSNTTTLQMDYTDEQRNGMILNGYNGATQGNGTLDEQWPVCVGCAMLSRSFDRTGETVPDACKQCFDRYCWNGTTADGARPHYNPTMKLGEIKATSAAGHFMPNVVGLGVAAAVAGLLML